MEAPLKKSAKRRLQSTASSSSSSSSVITDLPGHILMEILCRLPIKVLMASKIVCKSWFNLIKDPQFAQLHQSRAPTLVCFQFQNSHDDIKSTKLYLGNFHTDPFEVKLNTLLELPKFSVRLDNSVNYHCIRHRLAFVNSCNGLQCYYGDPSNFAVIWNPITSEFITIPAPKVDKVLKFHAYGFGFSEKGKKYKLLRMMGRENSEKDPSWPGEVISAEICTIEKGFSWKTVGRCPSGWQPFGSYLIHGFSRFWDRRPLHASFLRGTLHWVGADSRMSDVTAIVSFDFEDERFGRVPLPRDFNKTEERVNMELTGRERLGVLAGCLFITDYTNEAVDVWLMKEYGIQDSWTKLFSVKFTERFGPYKYYEIFIPITYMDSGEIMIKHIRCPRAMPSDILLYDPVLDSIRVLGSGPKSNFFRVTAFKPSLVLLKDSMTGYEVHVKSRCPDSEPRQLIRSPHWWKAAETKLPSPHLDGSEAPPRNGEFPVAAVGEERGRLHGGATSESSIPESSTVELSHQHGSNAALTKDETCVYVAREESRRQSNETGMANDNPTFSPGKPATMEESLKRIEAMMEEVLEERRKERQRQKELEERLRNEVAKVESLKEQIQQTEQQLKHENQQLEERLRSEHAKVEQLQTELRSSNSKNQQMILHIVD